VAIIYLGRLSPAASSDLTREVSGIAGGWDGPPLLSYLVLHQMGFILPARLPGPRWALTSPFHLCLPEGIGRVFSVTLSVASLPPAVNRHPALRCSDFPHSSNIWWTRSPGRLGSISGPGSYG